MEFQYVILLIIAIVIVFFGFVIFILGRYRKCPPDKIMVISGRVGRSGESKSAKCIHGGASFILPVFQSYQYLDLTPMSINVPLKNALCRQNIRIDVPSTFTVGISTEPGVMQNAAERMLSMNQQEMQELVKDIIFGQLRLIIATMDIEEINSDRDKFLDAVSRNVESEIKKIGLRLINVNITDITDESGYIEALGKEAAARAINDAKKSVAERQRDGSIGEANALREQRIAVAQANASAIAGENEVKIQIADSDAIRREREAEALRRASAAEQVQEANARREAYIAQKEAEETRASLERATLEADTLVQAQIEKQRKEIEAEATAEQLRRQAQGEADAIYAKMEAQARGMQEILTRQAEGLKEIVMAAGGNANDAVKLIIADKMDELVKTQVEAIKNLKIDKITVWDNGAGKDGASTTANFISSIIKSVPPMAELFRNAGMQLPEYLGKELDPSGAADSAVSASTGSSAAGSAASTSTAASSAAATGSAGAAGGAAAPDGRKDA